MDATPSRHSAPSLSRPRLVVWAASLAVGGFLGSGMHVNESTGGFGWVGALAFAILAVTILVVMGVIALILALAPDESGHRAARAIVVAAIALAVGVGIGRAIAPMLSGRVAFPLEARGTMSLSTDGLERYVGSSDAVANCRSVPDSDAVAYVDANVVGSVGTGMVGVSVVMLPPDSADGRPTVQVWIQPADKTVGVAPAWQALGDIVERGDGDRSGRIAFNGATLSASDGSVRQPEGWPAELSGTVSWTCGDWTIPGAEATPR